MGPYGVFRAIRVSVAYVALGGSGGLGFRGLPAPGRLPPEFGLGPPEFGLGPPEFALGPPEFGLAPPELGLAPPEFARGPPQPFLRGDGLTSASMLMDNGFSRLSNEPTVSHAPHDGFDAACQGFWRARRGWGPGALVIRIH